MNRVVGRLLLAATSALAATLALTGCDAASTTRGTVCVAASLQDAVAKILAADAAAAAGLDPRLHVAASSTLARQIAAGLDADCFVSANREWVDFLAQRDLLEPATRQPLLRNQLVLVTPKRDGKGPDLDWRHLDGRLAMGDPSHVPAGQYGKKALQGAGLWERYSRRLVPTADVRAALVLAERGEVSAALVYATDATACDKVDVLHRFTGAAAPEVVYEIALLRGGDKRILQLLTGAAATAVYRELGFEVLPR